MNRPFVTAIPQAFARGIAVIAVGVIASIGLAGSASAHSVLISMTPADGSLVMTAPTQVVLTFDENVQSLGDAISVIDPMGKQIQDGTPQVLNNTMTQTLTPITVPGHYQVLYRVVSADGHPVTKELGFNYLSAAGPTGAPAPVDSGASSWLSTALVTLGIVAVAAAGFVFMRRRSAGSGESTN